MIANSVAIDAIEKAFQVSGVGIASSAQSDRPSESVLDRALPKLETRNLKRLFLRKTGDLALRQSPAIVNLG